MYLSHSFLLTILPFLTAAIPLAQPLAPHARGIAIPISKRIFDTSKARMMVQRSVGQVFLYHSTFQVVPVINQRTILQEDPNGYGCI